MTTSSAIPDSRWHWTSNRKGLGTLSRLMRRPAAALSLAVLLVLGVAAVAAPLIAPFEPDEIGAALPLQGPSIGAWFGSDQLGRDLFSRMLYGGRLALGITLGATIIAISIGATWGALAGARVWVVDEVGMRIADIIMAIPLMLFALILVSAVGSTLFSLTVILGLIFTPGTARILRAAFASELARDYSHAARAYGASTPKLLFTEVLPNTVPTLLAQTSLVAAGVLLTEASLSFIGLGVTPPAASWGSLLQIGYSGIHQSYWFVVFPAIAIIVTVLCLNTLGDHLQAILDPSADREVGE